MGLENAGDVTQRKRAEYFGDFEKVSLWSWELDTKREGSIFGARRGQTNLRATGAERDGRQMEKSSYKDCASLFLMSKP